MSVQTCYAAIVQLVLTRLDHTFAVVTLVIKGMGLFVMVSNSTKARGNIANSTFLGDVISE